MDVWIGPVCGIGLSPTPRHARSTCRMTVSSARPQQYRQFSASPNTGAHARDSKPHDAKRAENSVTVDARIGSAPFIATFQCASDSFASASPLTRRMHSAYPKFGAVHWTRCVSFMRVIICNQTTGRCKKVKGEVRSARQPQIAAERQPPMRPMSWYCGSHEATPILSWSRKAISRVDSLTDWIAKMLFIRLRVPTITPFGWPVEPDVYCRNATSSGGQSSHRVASQPLSHSSSRAERRRDRSSEACHFQSEFHLHSSSRMAMLQSHCARR
mmetsp:Transcript_41115/g.133794  ORF Transcript_41115/g.133794 Transcript_41115/m.133794 type:complete len:271 (+) Transcript_41115:1067-1879(+)